MSLKDLPSVMKLTPPHPPTSTLTFPLLQEQGKLFHCTALIVSRTPAPQPPPHPYAPVCRGAARPSEQTDAGSSAARGRRAGRRGLFALAIRPGFLLSLHPAPPVNMHMFDSEVAGREEDRSLSERPTSWMTGGVVVVGQEGWCSVHHASAPRARSSRSAARAHPLRIDNIKRERSQSGHKQEVDDSRLEARGLMVGRGGGRVASSGAF
ncbi:unnamed protein product [Arctogadus glacialis]